MTDKDIKKALECCGVKRTCRNCPLYEERSADCIYIVLKNTLDLITRQQAEIEKLKDANNIFEKAFHIQEQNIKDWLPITMFNYEIKTEAYKEFAERLKEDIFNTEYHIDRYYRRSIDNLVKEMVGDDNA